MFKNNVQDHSGGDRRLSTVKNIYILHVPIRKAVLFGGKSGTLTIEKRYFSTRKVPLSLFSTHKQLIVSHIHENRRQFGIYFTNTPHFPCRFWETNLSNWF